MSKTSWYSRFAKAAAHFCGRPRVFVLAVGVVAIWVVTGPIFEFSDTWQLVINTATTIVTFLQLKLDELIRSTRGAHNALLDLEVLEEDTLDAFRAKYAALASAARTQLDRGLEDTGTPEA